MATGTGKTRMAVALVEQLMKAGWVKRVLFLADRTALVRQAKNAFKAHLPSVTPVDLTKETETSGSRVLLSTYPTMMNALDEAKGAEKRFGPGYFDLIIIDEAHRSVYQKYRAIFEYFDALLLGLTATPRDEVDRDTYGLFDLETGVPTYYYELDEAVADEYLVPAKGIPVDVKFQRTGIRYNDLSDEEKEEYERVFGDPETGEGPDEISGAALNLWLFNQDTVDQVLRHLMEHGLRVAGGDRLGKTIIFARNHKHAVYIQERFDANYPLLKGKAARVIDSHDAYAENLLEQFATPTKEPTIAISVDMLDTGVDVPEIVNLVFFKPVRSKTKFHQMMGRGTRLREDLFGPGDDKECFYVFDFCGNFDFFDEHPDGVTSRPPPPMRALLFDRRLRLAAKLAEEGGAEGFEDVDPRRSPRPGPRSEHGQLPRPPAPDARRGVLGSGRVGPADPRGPPGPDRQAGGVAERERGVRRARPPVRPPDPERAARAGRGAEQRSRASRGGSATWPPLWRRRRTSRWSTPSSTSSRSSRAIGSGRA